MEANFIIEQFEDKELAHFGYAIISEQKMVVIDPARNPQAYFDLAQQHQAQIVAIIETHPHADFISSHLEISKKTGAPIYINELLGATYQFIHLAHQARHRFGGIELRALHTPGHSPDSICVVLSENGQDKAVFTGDTLFIGDCGRPDLREAVGNTTASRQAMAKDMYHSLRNFLLTLADDVHVYPAHGAGSLCGKALKAANRSSIGAEKLSNWSLQPMAEADFIAELTSAQPFIPKYFGFDVDTNRAGAADYQASIDAVRRLGTIANEADYQKLDKNTLIIDTRKQTEYQKAHLPNSINLMVGGKFETWLGSIVSPKEPFYLLASSEAELEMLISRIARIGYEAQIKGAFVGAYFTEQSDSFDLEGFRTNSQAFTVVDIRNSSESAAKNYFPHSVNIPLAELRERAGEIPTNKPIVVHCAGGYRSAAGASILKQTVDNQQIYDLSEAISSF